MLNKVFTNKWVLIGLAVTIIGLVVFLFVKKYQKEKAGKETIDKINEAVANGTGVSGNTAYEASTGLNGVVADPNYSAKAKVDAKALEDAKGYFKDDDATVFKTLQNKTKAQLKAIENSLKQLYGYGNIDEYLHTIFQIDVDLFGMQMPCIGFDCENYRKAVNIINSAI